MSSRVAVVNEHLAVVKDLVVAKNLQVVVNNYSVTVSSNWLLQATIRVCSIEIQLREKHSRNFEVGMNEMS